MVGQHVTTPGSLLRLSRQLRRATLEDVARVAKLTPSMLSLLERDRRGLSVTNAVAIIEALRSTDAPDGAPVEQLAAERRAKASGVSGG